MDHVLIERSGGFAGLRARAEIEVSEMASEDLLALEKLFQHKGALPSSPGADRFTYTVTRRSDRGETKLAIPEHLMPPGLAGLVKDTLP